MCSYQYTEKAVFAIATRGRAHVPSFRNRRRLCRLPPFSSYTLIRLRLSTKIMSTSQQVSSATPNFQPILDKALKEYKRKTGKELTTHPLAEEINGCSSPDAILAVLQGKANELNQSQSSDERLTKWLTPTVNVLNALSATLGQGVGTASPNVIPYLNCLTLTFRYSLLPR
jgi:hypothetical protein